MARINLRKHKGNSRYFIIRCACREIITRQASCVLINFQVLLLAHCESSGDRLCQYRLNASGSEEMVLIAQLLSADPHDSAVVRGILVALFAAKLPAPVAKKKHEKMMQANGLCYPQALRVLTVGNLESLGVPMGEALMILSMAHVEPSQSGTGVPAETEPQRRQRH